MDKDYFSAQADAYKAFRPGYPDALFESLCRELPEDAIVWDCATGSGQAAVPLARRVPRVIASDQSATQLANARWHENVGYIRAYAEVMPLSDRSVDLVTIAQALHWFDFDRFYAEVRRVVKPGGMIAAWTYSFLQVTPQLGEPIGEIVRSFYHDVVGPYWPPERRMVDDQYRTIPFPYEPLSLPEFAIATNWDMPAMLGYLSSWSATQGYRNATGSDPLPGLAERLLQAWGEPATTRALRWPLALRCGRV